MAKRKVRDYGTGIPDFELASLARLLLPEIRAYFQSEEGKREYAEWLEEQKNNAKGANENERIE